MDIFEIFENDGKGRDNQGKYKGKTEKHSGYSDNEEYRDEVYGREHGHGGGLEAYKDKIALLLKDKRIAVAGVILITAIMAAIIFAVILLFKYVDKNGVKELVLAVQGILSWLWQGSGK